MKKSINAWVATFVACGTFVMGVSLGNWSYKDQINKIQAYRGYVVSTEHLLDLINAKWSWVDAFDHDGYYESRAEIEYLDSYGLLLEAERYAKAINDDSILINEIYGKN